GRALAPETGSESVAIIDTRGQCAAGSAKIDIARGARGGAAFGARETSQLRPAQSRDCRKMQGLQLGGRLGIRMAIAALVIPIECRTDAGNVGHAGDRHLDIVTL